MKPLLSALLNFNIYYLDSIKVIVKFVSQFLTHPQP